MLGSMFVHPLYLWGAGLVAAPVLIHLLHRYRYRRVRWAPMVFLLEGQRRQRRRILLEQLLLLALRCLLVLAIVAIVARPLLGEGVGAMLAGGRQSSHLFVLDDSASMGERQGAASPFALGRRAAVDVARSLADRPGRHAFTLLRTSRAAEPVVATGAIDRSTVPRIETALGELEPTYLALSPAAGVEAALPLLEGSDASGRVLHLASDFRTRDWREGSRLPELLKKVSELGAKIVLIDAARSPGVNLSVERLAGRVETSAVGVPFRLSATIRNQSNKSVERLSASPRFDGRALTTSTIERMEPNGTGELSFDVAAATTGWHESSLHLPEDALEADDQFYVAFETVEQIPVLIVDGDPARADAGFLSLALSPGGAAKTGLEPVVRGPEALTAGGLEAYPVVFVLNVGALTARGASALEKFVEDGGGLAIFLGDQVRSDVYQASLFGAQDGLFPIRLGAVRSKAEARDGPDIRPTNHPLFRVFQGERNPFLETVRIERFFTLAEPPPTSEKMRVIATLKDGEPLVLEADRGRGKALLFLTTAGTAWNNWGRNPSYVVAMLELYTQLARSRRTRDRYVGQPWRIPFDPARDRREATVQLPSGKSSRQRTVQLTAAQQGAQFEATLPATDVPGVYRATIRQQDGKDRSVAAAFNVDWREGDLAKASRERLAEALAGVPHEYYAADEFRGEAESSTVEPREYLLTAFFLLLFVEQAMAYRLSYHLR